MDLRHRYWLFTYPAQMGAGGGLNDLYATAEFLPYIEEVLSWYMRHKPSGRMCFHILDTKTMKIVRKDTYHPLKEQIKDLL